MPKRGETSIYPADGVFHTEFDDEPPSYATTRAIAAIENVEVTEVPPLYSSIDLEALNLLFQQMDSRAVEEIRVQFSISGYSIIVQNNEIAVYEM